MNGCRRGVLWIMWTPSIPRFATLTGSAQIPFPLRTASAAPTASIAAGAIIALEPSQIERPAGIALNDLLTQQRPLARFPERCRVDDPVAKRTAIGTTAARDRARNAD